jgi:BirA family biotin operon repressor/biotin-[acetyl-CoA-carboxylase] ligase
MQGPKVPVGFDLVRLDRIDSTNEEAKRRCAAGAADGSVVWAKEQTVGRGRRRRTWFSPPGNLYFSVVVRPHVPVAAAAQIGFVTALAAAEAVSLHLDDSSAVACKWPNDVLIDGRKVAGILLESSMGGPSAPDWLVVGVGVNIAWRPDDADILYPATTLALAGGAAATPASVLEAFLVSFGRWRTTWERDGFAPIRTAWRRRAYGLGTPIDVRLEAETLSGVFADLDEEGALILRSDDGVRRVTAGDVFPAGQPPGRES